jgi:hypothetical protein
LCHSCSLLCRYALDNNPLCFKKMYSLYLSKCKQVYYQSSQLYSAIYHHCISNLVAWLPARQCQQEAKQHPNTSLFRDIISIGLLCQPDKGGSKQSGLLLQLRDSAGRQMDPGCRGELELECLGQYLGRRFNISLGRYTSLPGHNL